MEHPTHIVLIFFKSSIIQATIAYSAQEAADILDATVEDGRVYTGKIMVIDYSMRGE